MFKCLSDLLTWRLLVNTQEGCSWYSQMIALLLLCGFCFKLHICFYNDRIMFTSPPVLSEESPLVREAIASCWLSFTPGASQRVWHLTTLHKCQQLLCATGLYRHLRRKLKSAQSITKCPSLNPVLLHGSFALDHYVTVMPSVESVDFLFVRESDN